MYIHQFNIYLKSAVPVENFNSNCACYIYRFNLTITDRFLLRIIHSLRHHIHVADGLICDSLNLFCPSYENNTILIFCLTTKS